MKLEVKNEDVYKDIDWEKFVSVISKTDYQVYCAFETT